MSELLVDQLMRRVEELEAERRRWRSIGIGALLALGLCLSCGGVLFVGTTAVGITGYRSTRMEALEESEMIRREAQMAAEQARMEAEQAREAERALREAEGK
jgi:PAS domain-containing protein